MQPESDLNPYAAPQSDVTPRRDENASLRRPASSLWVLRLLWIALLFDVSNEIIDLLEGGPAPFTQFHSPWTLAFFSLVVLNLVAFHAFKRSRITYALGLLYMLLLEFEFLEQTFQIASIWSPPDFAYLSRYGLAIAILLTTLISWLFYRFTFGLPSRRYYRVTRN